MRIGRVPRVALQRVAALLLVVLAVPAVLTARAFADDDPIRVGAPSPRTVIAPETIRVVDVEATERARREAADAVPEVLVFDHEAQAAVVQRVRDVFTAVLEVRRPVGVTPGPGPSPTPTLQVPSIDEQLAALRERTGGILDDTALRLLIGLSDRQVQQVEQETVAIAQQLARQRITAEELPRVLDEQLPGEIALRDLPPDVAEQVVDPLIRAVMRPTVRVDDAATAAAREQAMQRVAEVVRTFPAGTPIVRAGEVVDQVRWEALQLSGFEGTDPWRELGRAVALMAVIAAVGAAYLRTAHRTQWRSGRTVLLLGVLILGYSLLVAAASFLVDATGPAWWYAVPAGGLGMLATVLVRPATGSLMTLPAVAIPLLVAGRAPGLAVFAVAATLGSVPLVARITARSDLRRASWATLGAYPLLAVASAVVLEPNLPLGVVAVAGAANAVVTSLLVHGLLPFLEATFRVATVTTLLDLADRNHPLLRELEQKALGTYNHSVMVATLVERACRRIGANALLASVAALYHDIGKVRRPHFFIENQQGIPNPHDDLEPEVSALIIQDHVRDGVRMARSYRLPPEVVSCIAAHHGTMLVSYFYRKALEQARRRGETVDEARFRYPGEKPRRKEAAVLFLADACEATTRSMALERGTLSREEIEATVDQLFEERIADGQLDEADLTFAELKEVRAAVIEGLVGVYHPRIAYPRAPEQRTAV